MLQLAACHDVGHTDGVSAQELFFAVVKPHFLQLLEAVFDKEPPLPHDVLIWPGASKERGHPHHLYACTRKEVAGSGLCYARLTLK